jgi:hypothetical protein
MLPPEVSIPAEVPEGHHHFRSTGLGWLDKLLPVSAIMISVISLGVAIHHGGIMNEMAENNARAAEASVWPFVQLDTGNTRGNDQGNVYADLVNKGVGPARIESFEFFYRGRAYPDFMSVLNDCCMADVPNGGKFRTQTGQAAPGVIAPKEGALLFEMPRTGAAVSAWDKFDALRGAGAFSARGCYCSVYDKCWVADFKSAKRTSVGGSCPAVKVQFQNAISGR